MLLQRVKRDGALDNKAETTFVAVQETPQRFGKQKDLTRKETPLTDATKRWGQFVNGSFTTCFKRVEQLAVEK
jgi:hypothetical protein